MLFVILSLVWGSSFILIKKALVAFEPGVVGALRIVSASIFLFIPAVKRISKIKRNHILSLLTVGFVGSLIPAFLFAKAQTQLDSAIAGVMNALTPLFVILIGILFFYQKITSRIFAGVLMGFLGTFC